MRVKRRIPDRSHAIRLRVLRDRIIPPPAKGAHRGKGRHVFMSDTWNGDGFVPIGWSGFNGDLEEFTDVNQDTSIGYRVDFPDDMDEIINISSLTISEKDLVMAAFNSSENRTRMLNHGKRGK